MLHKTFVKNCTVERYSFASYIEVKEGTPMGKQKNCVYLNKQETRVLKSLTIFKNMLTQQDRYTDVIDDLIMKVLSAPVKRI